MALIYGGVGNGKTYLCEATAIELSKRGILCRVLTMAQMMTALKKCLGADRIISLEELTGLYCKAHWLIIDDVGSGGTGTEWEMGKLEEIIAYRYREELPTLMTSNLDIQPDPNNPKRIFIPERIVSRFRDPDIGTLVLNEGGDYRRMKKW